VEQWKAAFGWYFEWLRFVVEQGRQPLTLEERVFQAVDRAGGRRGLARRTRETYGRWAIRFARWAGVDREMLNHERGRDFLTYLVIDEKQSFSTQKQALNALVFFYREVCGQEEVDLQVKLRRTTPRIPVIVNFREIMSILEKLDERYRLMAEMQYGGGLRLKELAQLRIKDVDLDRRQITIRGGKGDLDCLMRRLTAHQPLRAA
jgi:integrase